MQAIQHHDAGAFVERVKPMLAARECENCAMIGLSDALANGRLFPASDPVRLMVTLEQDGEIRGVALQTRPLAMLVTRVDSQEVDTLARMLREMHWPGRGFNGPTPGVDLLADRWCELSGQRKRQHLGLRVFQLTRVAKPRRVAGRMRPAEPDLIDVLARWRDEFGREIGEPGDDSRRVVERSIREGRLFAWDDDGIRSMAQSAGPTPHGMRINCVYTPPEWRGRGYASNLVAGVSQHLLDSGRRFCFLFTDLANPTSNHIYQQIGYEPVSDFRTWVVEGSAV